MTIDANTNDRRIRWISTFISLAALLFYLTFRDLQDSIMFTIIKKYGEIAINTFSISALLLTAGNYIMWKIYKEEQLKKRIIELEAKLKRTQPNNSKDLLPNSNKNRPPRKLL